MEKFAKFISGYRKKMEKGGPGGENLHPRVKVALIDDGVDGLNGDLGSIIKTGKTFSERSKHEYNSYFKSTRGHGTIMATLIRKMCPSAWLYVAKLNEEKTWRNTMSITGESAVKVRAAHSNLQASTWLSLVAN
jgi:subtilisin family serine protease